MLKRIEQNPVRRVVIIGGGISGLAAAHRLVEERAHKQEGHTVGGARLEVMLLEGGPRLGGTIRTYQRDGFLLEGGPDSFISEKPEAVALAGRIGLAPHLIETTPGHRRSFIVRGGRLHAVPEGFQLLAPSRFWPFVTTGIFSWPGKARMALDLVLPRRNGQSNDGVPAADESLAGFVRRRFGREALARMAQPMVGGIYTADPERLSLRATMPRFIEMERAHRSVILAMWKARREASRSSNGQQQQSGTSGARYSLFLSFDGGMQMLTDRLAALLAEEITIRLNTNVESLSFDGERWRIRTSANELIEADAVCLALPAYRAAELLREMDAPLAADLADIPYTSTATINFAYRRTDIAHPLDGFGFVAPFVERRAVLACSFSSVKFANRAPAGGHALLRAFVGGALQPEMFALDEEAMARAARADLEQLLGIKNPPLFVHVEKWPRSMAQYHVGHLEKIERIRRRVAGAHPSLALAGNAYAGAGIPDCIRSGQRAADSLIGATGAPR